jgi:hypothetical protein
MWTLLFIMLQGTFHFVQMPMMDRTACQEAANTFKNNSEGFAIMCVSSNTGEVVKIREGKK